MSKLNLKSQPTLADIQAYVREMETEREFMHNPIELECLLLSEEMGELFKCIRKTHTKLGIDSNKTYDFNTAGEIADVLIVLVAIANRLNIDIEQALRDKEEKNKQRIWK